MTKAKSSVKGYPEIKEIRNNLGDVVSNVVGLGHHLQENGIEKVNDMVDQIKVRSIKAARKAIARSAREFVSVERHVKAKPVESVMLAFGAGLLAHIAFRSKR